MSTITWKTIARILLKTAVLFLFLNLLFAWLVPLEALGHLSLYNWLLPGRLRLPYGENPAASNNLSLYNVPAMLASHTISRPKAADEFRVLLIGDSGTWGWFLENGDTLAGQLNAMNLQSGDGRSVRVYNLGYPVLALSKDLLLLDAAMPADPDLILWPVTLDSFPRDKQLFPPLVQHNPERMRHLIGDYGLDLDPDDGRFVTPAFLERTIVGQRRNLADLLRLQQVGFAWAATGIDQAVPAQFELRRSDFEADESWQSFTEPTTLTADDLAFDVLAAGLTLAGDVPVLLINEPMFISQGQNSDLRYNSFYPRWAYDQYRALLADTAVSHNWPYLDLWDTIPPDEFTDTPVHLTTAGNRLYAALVAEGIRPFLGEIGDSPNLQSPTRGTMNDEQTIREKLLAFITRELIRDAGYDLRDDEGIITGGLMDSFALAEFGVYVEEEFDIYIPDADLTVAKLDTLNQMVARIQRDLPGGLDSIILR